MGEKKVICSMEKGIGKRSNLLLNPNDIEKRAYYLDDALHLEITLNNDAIPVKGMDLDNFHKSLEKELQGFLETTDMPVNKGDVESIRDLQTEELQELIKHTTGLQTTVHFMGYYPKFDDSVIVYDKFNNKFMPLDEEHFERCHVYEYFDGSNWQQIVNEPEYGVTTTEVEYSGVVSLDEYDGTHFTTGVFGEHEHVSIITSIDGDAPYNDEYLVVHTSQRRGILPEAEIMDRQALKDHLEKLGRDVDKYMKEIDDEHDHVELMVLKRDADFEEDINKLEKYGEVKAYAYVVDVLDDLRERGLQSYRIDDTFSDFVRKNGERGMREGFDCFEWQTENGEPLMVPIQSLLHESSGHTYYILNKSDLEKQLAKEQVNQKHSNMEMEM